MESLTARFHKKVFLPYLDLLKAQYRFHPTFEHAMKMWEKKLTAEELVNGPYLEKSQIYAAGESLESLSLHEETVTTIRKKLEERNLYKHQTDALKMLLGGENAVIATGTSSGKTLCYQIPILDDLIRNPSYGLRAIIIYPLNALVNDQLEEWEQILKDYPQIRFARFTGQAPASQEDYEGRLKNKYEQQLQDQGFSQNELQREKKRRLEEELSINIPNHLYHREDIRQNPPQILITNFSMLEYLLERPIDAPIFENARLNFLVLDEAHAYRGVQATEIAFLIRRIKDRLGIDKLTCIATSATLGKQGDAKSESKVRKFASKLFGEEFNEPNPIYGTTAEPILNQPSFQPTVDQYINAASTLRNDTQADIKPILGISIPENNITAILSHDNNLYLLRKEILTKPRRLKDASQKLWPDNPDAEEGLLALLEIASLTKKYDDSVEDLLPTRLHYFIKAQDGLHICLHKKCPGRVNEKPAFFVSRKNGKDTPEGNCPECHRIDNCSKLVEVVACRKCGYLFGALQDLGPRRAQNPEKGSSVDKPSFDSFSTELGWAADSYWSYLSVENDLPYPAQPETDEDEDDSSTNLFMKPAELQWCIVCGKKKDEGAGDNCQCEKPHLRNIKIFHRQCPHTGKSNDYSNLYSQGKSLLTRCPNCGARNASGLEPVRRFQESDDETGLAIAIPFSHFQVSLLKGNEKQPRKLLCFTDHRQRAAAFPSLLEEETFTHDMGNKIVEIVNKATKPIDLIRLGEHLADITDKESKDYDPDFFLPVSRCPDEEPDKKGKRNFWIAETFGYFGIPDAARESAEDFGLVAVYYSIKDNEKATFHTILKTLKITSQEADAVLQILIGFMRQRKAFTLPAGVEPDDPAFGRVLADIFFAKRKEGIHNANGWLPRLNMDGSYKDNYFTSYLRRLFGLSPDQILTLAENIWDFLVSESLLIEGRGKDRKKWKLDHERLRVVRPTIRYVCNRCGIVTTYSAKNICPRKECIGTLDIKHFDTAKENIIALWIAGKGEYRFTGLKSEEHTAQISKELAKAIEEEFRGEGVNLLSSTTTFEMGINIGDLQKVLLRNAPPTSASYIQRVGRSCRGKDKNSVSVTLCRRTKYDADAWSNPPRIMSGEVRTPTVFLQNKVISQRHFNAVVFAKFLRIKISGERVLGAVKQKCRLEAFLPLDSRKSIPEKWKQCPTAIFLDFIEWLKQQDEMDIFMTDTGRLSISSILGFDEGKKFACKKYEEVLKQIVDETVALLAERKKLYDAGRDNEAGSIGNAIKNILDSDIINILAKHGFLPRYAFPLDVVTLETSRTRWSRDEDVELSRERGIAIAEFAPGAQVISHKKVFTSAGLYIVSRKDMPDRKWYFKCPDKSCERIQTGSTLDSLKGHCPMCQRSITAQYIKPFVEPFAFSVRFDQKSGGAARHRKSTLIRQRQSLTHFIDSVDETDFKDFRLFHVALKENGKFFRYNLGPENKGFVLCTECGFSAPYRDYKANTKHEKLRVFSGTKYCRNEKLSSKPIAYGHGFYSFCLVIRPSSSPIPVESMAFALQKGLCITLDLETSDIGVSWRWLASKSTRTGAEIILYDYTPGGSGFVKEGFENWEQVVKEAQIVCENCNCEKACYDCLKNYGNQSHHENLDRNTVKRFLE